VTRPAAARRDFAHWFSFSARSAALAGRLVSLQLPS
jgi:hypothetical protein